MCKALSSLIDLLIGGLFVFAASAHLQNPFLSLESILAYELVSARVVPFAAEFLTFMELSLGLCLVHPTTRAAGRKIAVCLLTTFTFAQLTVLYRDIEIDCGCFGGILDRNVTPSTVSTNLVFILLVISSSILDKRVCNPS